MKRLKTVIILALLIYGACGLPRNKPNRNGDCRNHLSMIVNGATVPNGGLIKLKTTSELQAVCTETSAEGTHLYWILDNEKITGTPARRSTKSFDITAFAINFRTNVTDKMHQKTLRCVADHSPSNCFETTRGIIHILQ